MNRFKEVNETSEIFLNELLEKRKKITKQYFIKEQRAWRFKFCNALMPFIEKNGENMKNLVISCLSSSIVTNDNTYQISLYNDDIYVDPYPPCIYYMPEFLFYEIEKDNEEIKEFLRKHFIRMMDYEVEEVRRKYMVKVYFSCKNFFIDLLPDDGKKDICVWFGEYMKSAEYIGRI